METHDLRKVSGLEAVVEEGSFTSYSASSGNNNGELKDVGLLDTMNTSMLSYPYVDSMMFDIGQTCVS